VRYNIFLKQEIRVRQMSVTTETTVEALPGPFLAKAVASATALGALIAYLAAKAS
jgi:hypothetical protein